MTDWLVVMSEDNWEISERVGLLGLGTNAERRLGQLGEGDRVWVYVNRKHVDRQVPRVRQFRAVVRVAGPVQHLDKSPWRPRGTQRFTVARPITIERRLSVAALDLLKTLSFAGRPPVWGIRLLSAPLRLTEDDVAKLERASA